MASWASTTAAWFSVSDTGTEADGAHAVVKEVGALSETGSPGNRGHAERQGVRPGAAEDGIVVD